MEYAVPYEFVPFEKAGGQSAGSYNDLIDQVVWQVSKILDFGHQYLRLKIYMLALLCNIFPRTVHLHPATDIGPLH